MPGKLRIVKIAGLAVHDFGVGTSACCGPLTKVFCQAGFRSSAAWHRARLYKSGFINTSVIVSGEKISYNMLMSPMVESRKGTAVINGEIRITHLRRNKITVEIFFEEDRRMFQAVYDPKNTSVTADEFGPVTWNGQDVKSFGLFGRVQVIPPQNT